MTFNIYWGENAQVLYDYGQSPQVINMDTGETFVYPEVGVTEAEGIKSFHLSPSSYLVPDIQLPAYTRYWAWVRPGGSDVMFDFYEDSFIK